MIIAAADLASSHAVNTLVNMAAPSNVDDPPTVDALKQSRRLLRAQLVRRIRELEAELARTEPNATVVQAKLEMIQKCYDRAEALDLDSLAVVNRHTVPLGSIVIVSII